jgi:hypothetical protein
MRALGPYLLIELVVPGGTLIALLLWLSQKAAGRPNMRARLRRTADTVATLRLKRPGRRSTQPAADVALTLLSLEQQPNDLRDNRSSAVVELRGRQVRDRVRHGEKFEVGKTPRSGHRTSGHLEHISHYRSGRDAVLFKHYAVEHTARAA